MSVCFTKAGQEFPKSMVTNQDQRTSENVHAVNEPVVGKCSGSECPAFVRLYDKRQSSC